MAAPDTITNKLRYRLLHRPFKQQAQSYKGDTSYIYNQFYCLNTV